jgi:phage shock protein PspC (stress-responsive transcriptional regulator)
MARKAAKPKRKPGKPKTQIDQNVEHFSQEMEGLGKRLEKKGSSLGKRWERKGKEKRCHHEWHSHFGIMGPLISSALGAVCLVILIWVMRFLAGSLSIETLSLIAGFLESYLVIFFIIGVVFSYAKYFMQGGKAHRLGEPLVAAAGITIAVWIIVQLASAMNFDAPIITQAHLAMVGGMLGVFIALLAIGYFILAIKMVVDASGCYTPPAMSKKEKLKPAPPGSRLYRSGKDRILGGVCGGIGEYLGIDPVIVRLLWVLFSLAGGSGILFYIIAWIIIPRNPKHKWDD